MNNEYYYRNELEKILNKFIEDETQEDVDDFGYLPDNIAKLMADAAFTVLATVRDCNDYFERENP